MTYRKILFSLINVFIVYSVVAQVDISGKIADLDGNPIPDAHIIVAPAGAPNSILAFAFSNEEGLFHLTLKTDSDSITLSIRSLGFKDLYYKLATNTQWVNARVESNPYSIDEVIVVSQSIRVRGDTISYLVNSFAKGSDASIGDVIRNMPGFEVTEQGTVLYQGKPIQKYYIEGLDLLEGSYSLANKNLPHRAVGAVEVLQNHQPIRILEGFMPSDGTSINLKLKRNVALTGNSILGGGYQPLAFEVNLTPMLFTKKQQAVASLQANNLGNELESQHNSLQVKSGIVQGFGLLNPSLVSVSQVQVPKMDSRRYLDNKSGLLAYRHLIKLNTDLELKFNASFYSDRIRRAGLVENQYFFSDTVVQFNETTQNHFDVGSLRIGASIYQNSKTSYLSNAVTYVGSWDSEKTSIVSGAALTQLASKPYQAFSNEFDWVLRNSNLFSRVYSSVNYLEANQLLSLFPGAFPNLFNNGIDYTTTQQHVELHKWQAYSFYKTSFSSKPWLFEVKPALKLEHGLMRTHIGIDNVIILDDTLVNSKKWNLLEPSLTGSSTYEKKSFQFSIDVPVKYRLLEEGDDISNVQSNPSARLFIEPSIFSKYRINGFWTINASLALINHFDDPQYRLNGYVVSDFKSLVRRNIDFGSSQSVSFGGEIQYRNAPIGLFCSSSYFRRTTGSNFLAQRDILMPGVLTFSMFKQKNQSIADNFKVELSYHLLKLFSTVSLKYGFSGTQKDELVSQNIVTAAYNLHSIVTSYSITRWKTIGIDYNYKYDLIQYQGANLHKKSSEQSHKLNLTYYPGAIHFMGVEGEFYIFIDDVTRKNEAYFLNLYYSLRPKNSKVQLQFRCSNILNNKNFDVYYISSSNFTRSSIAIRPRIFSFVLTMPLTSILK
jgi:hypothetical protein